MSQPKPTEKIKYTEAKKEFKTCAEIFLMSARKIVKTGADAESKVRVITVMQAVKNLLSTLRVKMDNSWEDASDGSDFSASEFDFAARQLRAAGLRLQSSMNNSWPVKDEMGSLLEELLSAQFDKSEKA